MEEKQDIPQMSTGDPVPEHLHILKHTHRSASYSNKNEQAKSILSTDQVAAVHNHFPFS